MSSSAAAVADRAGVRARTGPTLALLAFAQLIISIDYNIVYVALPEIGAGLGFAPHNLQWVVSAYAVAFGGFLLFGGRACDLFGRRRMFVLGLALYATASLVGGFAGDTWVLIAARAVQGLGGAVLFPATLSLVVTTFTEGAARNRALSVWAATGASGMVVGSLLGGVLTQAFGWEAVFFVNVPLAAAAIPAALRLIAPDTAHTGRRGIDLPGALTVTVGATLVVFTLVQGPVSGWSSPRIVIAALAGVLLLGLFVLVESRSRDPLVPLRLFGHRNLSTGAVVTFLFMATFGGLLYILTVYFQGVHHYSALRTGLAFVVPMVAGFVGSMLGGRVLTRFGVRPSLMVSLAVGSVGTLLLGLAMAVDGSYVALLPGLTILSICQGVVFTTMFAAASAGVAPQEQGIASGIVSTGQQVGSAVGLAVLVAIANAGLDGHTGEALQAATVDGLRSAIFAVAAGALVTIAVVLNFRPGAGGADHG